MKWITSILNSCCFWGFSIRRLLALKRLGLRMPITRHGDGDSLTHTRYNRIPRVTRKGRRVMIHSVKISGYRTFNQFEMSGLGRVNLLVGRNNTGKTSILEGLYILASGNNPSALWYV